MATLAGLRWANVPLLLEFKPDLLLRLSLTRLPVQVKDLTDRPQIIFGMSMAVQAPTHRKRFLLVNNVHVIHLTVAADATDAAIDVHRMIEIRKIRHLVDLDPVDRIPALPTLPHRGQFGIIRLNLGVAIHAGLRGGNIRMRRNLHVRVTIPAIHAELRHMDVMRERHWLNRLVTSSQVFRRQVVPVDR